MKYFLGLIPPIIKVFFLLLFVLMIAPSSMAQKEEGASWNEEMVGDESTVRAQETLSSLFARGSKLPEFPQIKGTVAIPSFDSSNMAIGEEAFVKTED